jgi:nucleoside phosphorylase
MIVCAGKTEEFPFATPIGVGLVESAMNLTQAVLFDRPEFLLFIGSAGSYGEYDPFTVVESRGATQIERAFWQKCAYTPIDNAIVSEGLALKHQTLVNSSNYITTCSDLNGAFLQAGIGLENMEFFSVLRVAQEHNIPAGGIFVVTNYCHKDAHKEYMSNIKTAKKLLQEYVTEKFKGMG